MSIIDETRAGMADAPTLRVEPDRRSAIAVALGDAGPGDLVVIPGKGHETTQTIGTDVLAFDDRRVAAEELGRLGWGVAP